MLCIQNPYPVQPSAPLPFLMHAYNGAGSPHVATPFACAHASLRVSALPPLAAQEPFCQTLHSRYGIKERKGSCTPPGAMSPDIASAPSRQSTGSETSSRCHLLASDTSKLSHVSETGDKGGLRQQTEGSSQQLLRKRMQLEAFAKYRSAHCLLGQQ